VKMGPVYRKVATCSKEEHANKIAEALNNAL
jgi:hypothetical protein